MLKKNKEKLEKKVQHLEKKHKFNEVVPETIREIKVSDQALGPEKPASKPLIFNIEKETISTNIK